MGWQSAAAAVVAWTPALLLLQLRQQEQDEATEQEEEDGEHVADGDGWALLPAVLYLNSAGTHNSLS